MRKVKGDGSRAAPGAECHGPFLSSAKHQKLRRRYKLLLRAQRQSARFRGSWASAEQTHGYFPPHPTPQKTMTRALSIGLEVNDLTEEIIKPIDLHSCKAMEYI